MPGLFPTAEENAYALEGIRRNEDRFYSLKEEQRNREQQLALQNNELLGRRQLANDQYGYESALSDQRFGQQAYRDQTGYMQENELFERHAAAQMSQQRLQQIQQERMAAIQRDAQRERDYLQQGFQQENVGQAQDFQARQAEKQFQQTKELADIQHGYGLENMDVQHQYGMEDQGSTQDFQLYRDQQLAKQHAQEELFHSQIVAQQEKVKAAIEAGYKAQAFSDENMYRARQILLEENKQGISNGTHVLNSEADKNRLVELRKKYSDISASQEISQKAKTFLLNQNLNDQADVYLNARKMEPDEVISSQAKIFEDFAKSLGLSADEAKYIKMGKNGPELDRAGLSYDLGLKKMEAQNRPIPPPAQLQQEFMKSIVTNPATGQQYSVKMQNGVPSYTKLDDPNKADNSPVNQLKEQAAIRKEIDSRTKEMMNKWVNDDLQYRGVRDKNDKQYDQDYAQAETVMRKLATESVMEEYEAAKAQQQQAVQPQPAANGAIPSASSREEALKLKAQGYKQFIGPDGQPHNL